MSQQGGVARQGDGTGDRAGEGLREVLAALTASGMASRERKVIAFKLCEAVVGKAAQVRADPIATLEEVLDVAAQDGPGRRTPAQLQRELVRVNRKDLARRIAKLNKGRCAWAHPDLGLAQAVQQAFIQGSEGPESSGSGQAAAGSASEPEQEELVGYYGIVTRDAGCQTEPPPDLDVGVAARGPVMELASLEQLVTELDVFKGQLREMELDVLAVDEKLDERCITMEERLTQAFPGEIGISFNAIDEKLDERCITLEERLMQAFRGEIGIMFKAVDEKLSSRINEVDGKLDERAIRLEERLTQAFQGEIGIVFNAVDEKLDERAVELEERLRQEFRGEIGIMFNAIDVQVSSMELESDEAGLGDVEKLQAPGTDESAVDDIIGSDCHESVVDDGIIGADMDGGVSQGEKCSEYSASTARASSW